MKMRQFTLFNVTGEDQRDKMGVVLNIDPESPNPDVLQEYFNDIVENHFGSTDFNYDDLPSLDQAFIDEEISIEIDGENHYIKVLETIPY